MNRALRAIRIVVPLSAAAVFCLWLKEQPALLSLGTLFAFVSLGLFIFALTAAVCRLAERCWGGDGSLPTVPDEKEERLSAWNGLLMFGVIVTALQFVAVYRIVHPGIDFFHSFRRLYYRSDVAHYMGIARDWYVQEGDERLRLVFLPLYPLTIKAVTWTGNYFGGALFAAQVFSLALLPAAYELFRLDMDRPMAASCARVLYLLPGAAFLRVPMSESLFLFLTLMAVYFARKKRFLWAALFTALSALTRSLGVLLLGLLFIEMLLTFLDKYREDRPAALGSIPRYLGLLLLGCSGTLIYLFINWKITGSPFTFLTYQRENWNQQLGFFFNTAAYQSEYALMYLKDGEMTSLLSLSLPNLICCFGALLLLCLGRKQLRVSYLLWALVYFAASIGATWLLSGPRYLAMLFPLAIALRQPFRSRTAGYCLEGLLLAVQTAYLVMLAMDMYVY